MNQEKKILELEKRIELLEKKATAATVVDLQLDKKITSDDQWEYWKQIISGDRQCNL